MSLSPRPPSPERSQLLLDFPVRLYTALRTMRLYPASNPQVQRSSEFLVKAHAALLAGDQDDSVSVALAEQQLLVCGAQLSDKDQTRPQIQGLITLFNRLNIHSLTFLSTFTFDQCIAFIQTLAPLLSEKELTGPLAALFDQAGIAAVTVDAKRYVAIHEGEQVVKDELIGTGLHITDEELANFVLGKTDREPHEGIAPELLQELLDRLPPTRDGGQHSEEATRAVIETLKNLSRESDPRKRKEEAEHSAALLSGLDPALLAQLVATLPPSPAVDEVLSSTLHHLSAPQLNTLIANLVDQQQALQTGPGGEQETPAPEKGALNRLLQLDHVHQPEEIQNSIARNLDARQLLLSSSTTLAELPPHLLERLKQPEWSAPVLVTAAQRLADPRLQAEGGVDMHAFNAALDRYQQLLSQEQQAQVARLAGAQLASMEGLALGNILAQKFKGLFGEQLYRQVLSQVSDELLDTTVEHLTPKQLNRMIAALTSIPFPAGKEKDPGDKSVDQDLLKRLAQTSKGAEISRAIARNRDAHMLQAPPEQVPKLPDQLLMRLQQPGWSAPVLVTAARQAAEEGSAFDRILENYHRLLSKENQLEVASQVGSQIADFDDQELGPILVRKFKNLFGEQLYRQIINQLSDEKLERLAKRMQAITEGREQLPDNVKNQDVEEAYNRLLQTVREEKMRAIIEMHREQQNLKEQERREAVKSRVANLLKGDLKDLENAEIHQELPETVKEMLSEHQEEQADNLLRQLAVGLQHHSPSARTQTFQTLAAIALQLAQLGQRDRLARLLPAVQQGLQGEGLDPQSIQQAMAAIGSLCGQCLFEENYAQAWEYIHFLRGLAADAVTGSPTVREQALETLKGLSTQAMLEQLLNNALRSDSLQEMAGKILVELGIESAKFQLHELMSSESRFERKRLLMLIKETGNPAVSLLVEQLHQESPWFVLRNVVRLLGELGNPALFSSVRPFITHPDLRVQQEVLNTAMKIGGENLKDFLLNALGTTDDALTVKVVNHIAIAHDERFVRPLTDLLESTRPFLGKNRSELQIALCKTLGAIGSKRATTTLSRVMQSKNVLGLTGYSDEVRKAAEQALEQIKIASRQPKDHDGEDSGTAPHPEQVARSLPDQDLSARIIAEEHQIFSLAARGERDPAKKMLVELVGTAARAGDYPTAERLRDRLYEIDPLAVGDIIRAGEIIEQEKKGAIKGEDLEIWARLTDRLGTEEFNALYHALVEQRYKPEETVVCQGDRNDTLFFITQGSIKVSHLADGRELFITTLNRGQIAGENFFTPSIWTVSLTSLTPSRVYILTQTALQQLQEHFPGLRGKLHELYTQGNTIGAMLMKKGLERRKDQRFTLSRKIQVQPISHLDTPMGRGFRAETADISGGGLSFLIRIARQENARLLLGRRMQVVLPVGGKTKFLYLKGLVIGIQPYQVMDNDFSVHFKFELPLESQELQTIIG